MSSKYVPPSLRNHNTTTSFSATGFTTVSRSTVPRSSVHDPVNSNSLVNTSLPAKESPKLVPGTLASLTGSGDVSSVNSSFKNMNLDKVSIYKGNTKKAIPTEDDFPTLGKPSVAAVKPVMNFAEKAREWAAKQQEDARIAAEEAEKERTRINIERMLREKEEKEEKLYKKTIISIASTKKTSELELERLSDKNDNTSDYDEEPYESPLDEDEEVEEEQEEYNSHWDGRRYRDEF